MNPEKGRLGLRLRPRPVARALLLILILLVIVISGFQVHGERGFLYSASYGFLTMQLHIRIHYLLAYHVFVHLCVLASWRESASSVELCLSDTCPFIENRGSPGLGSPLCFTPRRQAI